jgi:hypothetical protein
MRFIEEKLGQLRAGFCIYLLCYWLYAAELRAAQGFTCHYSDFSSYFYIFCELRRHRAKSAHPLIWLHLQLLNLNYFIGHLAHYNFTYELAQTLDQRGTYSLT